MTNAWSQSVALRRRGATAAGVLTTLLLLGCGVVTAVVVTPRYLTASAVEIDPPVPAANPKHQTVIDLFGAIVARSRKVLAVHAPGSAPYTEIVLWLEDTENPGIVDASEIAVVSHSAIMRTIVLYCLRPESDTGATTFERSDLASIDFCGAWRDREDVSRRVLAHGVAEVALKS